LLNEEVKSKEKLIVRGRVSSKSGSIKRSEKISGSERSIKGTKVVPKKRYIEKKAQSQH
jgi:hypothetical protein